MEDYFIYKAVESSFIPVIEQINQNEKANIDNRKSKIKEEGPLSCSGKK
jgi:hypothetical protein